MQPSLERERLHFFCLRYLLDGSFRKDNKYIYNTHVCTLKYPFKTNKRPYKMTYNRLHANMVV